MFVTSKLGFLTRSKIAHSRLFVMKFVGYNSTH